MKGQRIFPGIILIGFGLYFFLERSQIHIFTGFYTWPTLFCIVGLAFLIQAYYGKDVHAILPGVILFGFGVHFHLVQLIEAWPSHFGIFILIISIGFILQARKTKSGMFYGVTLCILAIFILFYDKVTSLLSLTQNVVTFWPFVLMAFGVYVLFFRKK